MGRLFSSPPLRSHVDPCTDTCLRKEASPSPRPYTLHPKTLWVRDSCLRESEKEKKRDEGRLVGIHSLRALGGELGVLWQGETISALRYFSKYKYIYCDALHPSLASKFPISMQHRWMLGPYIGTFFNYILNYNSAQQTKNIIFWTESFFNIVSSFVLLSTAVLLLVPPVILLLSPDAGISLKSIIGFLWNGQSVYNFVASIPALWIVWGRLSISLPDLWMRVTAG